MESYNGTAGKPTPHSICNIQNFMKFKTLAIVIPTLMSAGLFADPVKIACVGDSITYGDGVENREANNYPQQLQNMLRENPDRGITTVVLSCGFNNVQTYYYYLKKYGKNISSD